MVTLVNNKDIIIESDKLPIIELRCIYPTDNEVTRKDKKKFPIILRNACNIEVIHDSIKYKIDLPTSFRSDGASIPSEFYSVIGGNLSSDFLLAALVHDRLCNCHELVGDKRELSSTIFYELIRACGVDKIKARAMYGCVNQFQRGCGWKN